MTYFVCLLIVCGCGSVGWFLSRRFVVRVKFFKEIRMLVEGLRNNIIFNKSVINDIFSTFLKNSEFYEQINILYEIAVGANCDFIYTNKRFNFINNEEKQLLIKFFVGLGASNDEVECGRIDCFLNDLKIIIRELDEKRKVNEPILYKISLAVGVVISILIL